MDAIQLHKMLDGFETALRPMTQEAGMIVSRGQVGKLTAEDIDFAIDWIDDFQALLARINKLAGQCGEAYEALSEVMRGEHP